MSSERWLSLVVALLLVSFFLLYVVSRSRKPLHPQDYRQRRPSSEMRKLMKAEADNNGRREMKSVEVRSFSNTAVYSQQQQDWRRQLIIDGCRNQSTDRWSASRIKAAATNRFTLLVDDRLRYIYCRVAKVASTTWSRVLLVASGEVNVANPNKLSQSKTYEYLRDGYPLRRLSRYTPEEIEYRLTHYFKFMFVRHPLDRLVSAFKDRLKSKHMIPRRFYQKRIIRKYRRPDEVVHNKGVQFREFVRYIVDPETSKSGFNPHWRPQSNVCFPCHIDYDFIGHFETLSADAAAVLARINSSAAAGLRFPIIDPDNRRHSHNKSQRLDDMFNDIDPSDIRLLKTIVYANDFLLFGYK